MPLVKKLSQMGSSLGLILDKPILELLQIQRDTPLEITTDGDRLVIQPLRQVPRDEVKQIAARLLEQHAETFAKLAK